MRDRNIRWLVVPTILVAGALILTSCVRSPGTDPSSAPTEPATSTDSPSPSVPLQTATPAPTPGTVDGLPIYTVSELLDGRAAGLLEDGPIALRGYWSERTFMHTCAPIQERVGELELRCNDGEYGITERNEPIGELTVDRRFPPAKGPHLTPFLSDELWPGLGQLEIINGQRPSPVPILVVGHFDDPRAKDCRPKSAKLCADRFVIDRIVDYHPEAVPTPGVTPSPSPFPFESPPAPPFDVAVCAGDGPYSFVGWIKGEELHLDQDVPVTAYAAITRDVIEIGEWIDDPAGSSGRFRSMGRRICFAAEWDDGVISFAWVPGSAYREWDDGHHTPLLP